LPWRNDGGNPKNEHFETVVIGGAHAGLSVGYQLQAR